MGAGGWTRTASAGGSGGGSAVHLYRGRVAGAMGGGIEGFWGKGGDTGQYPMRGSRVFRSLLERKAERNSARSRPMSVLHLPRYVDHGAEFSYSSTVQNDACVQYCTVPFHVMKRLRNIRN